MATIYYPIGCDPYVGSWWYGDQAESNPTGLSWTEVTGEYIVDSSKTWQFGTYMSAMLQIDYNINGKTASGTIKYLMGRRNGNYGTNGTTKVTLDGVEQSYTGSITYGADIYKRATVEANRVIPWKYFTVVATFSFSATCDSSGNFSKSFNVIAKSGTSNMNMSSQPVSLSFDGGPSKPGKPSVSIIDHGNNTFSIDTTLGAAGNNNGPEAIDTESYAYSIDGADWVYPKSAGPHTLPEISDGSAIIRGAAKTKGTYFISDYGYSHDEGAGADVKYYHSPSVRPTPVISFTNKKPTLKSNFTISWDAGTPYGTASHNAIKGYRIELFKDSQIIKLGTSENYIEVADASSVSFNIIDKEFDIKVGDSIHATLRVWSENGESSPKRLYHDYSNPAISNYVTIVNMGVVWLRIGNAWIEGQVWSRDGSTWNECTGLFIRDTSWKESMT